MNADGIGIALTCGGATNLDELKISSITIDQRAKRLIDQRARDEGITTEDAFEKTLLEALHEYFESKNPRSWWM